MEEYIPWLKNAAISYLNIDVGVAGPIPDIDATPDLHAVGENIMKKIVWPYRNRNDLTMYDVWKYENPDAKPGVLAAALTTRLSCTVVFLLSTWVQVEGQLTPYITIIPVTTLITGCKFIPMRAKDELSLI